MMRRLLSTALMLLLCGIADLHAQIATVFNETFTTSAGTAFTTAAGPIGTSPVWNFSRSGVDYGSKINSGFLTLSNDASSAWNVTGWSLGYTNVSGFTSPYA